MFKFLKEKLKKGIKNISNQIEEEGTTEETVIERPIEEPEEQKEKKSIFTRLKDKFSKKEDKDIKEIIESDIDREQETKLKEESSIEEGISVKQSSQQEQKKTIETEDISKKIKIKDEVEEYQKKQEIQKEKRELETKEEKVKEKIKKKEIPKIQELAEKKEKEEEIKKIEKEIEEPKKEEQETEKKGFFNSIKEIISTKKINKEQFEKLFWDLEVALLENNVAVEVIEKIKDDLIQEIVEKPLPRGKIEEKISNTLTTSIKQILNVDSFNLLEKIKGKKPYVICFVGINGSGKTTSLAKITKLLLNNKISVVLAAADTFRAASIEQLQLHADKLKVKLIKHNYGSDPAAVAFDAVKYAKSKAIDVVLIDTAGRIHSNINLQDEMKKIVRVAKPDLKLFVGESITGNDCVEQAKRFNEAIGIDGIILSKADIDEKGGAALSVSYVTQKPILYIGTGQEYKDIKEFDPGVIMDSLGIS